MNPRYLAYCRLTGGLDPAATMARDLVAYPGGRMTGFVVWVAEDERRPSSRCAHLATKARELAGRCEGAVRNANANEEGTV